MSHSRSNTKGKKMYPRAPALEVTVTKEQIDHAVRGDSSHCMIGDAISQQYPWAEFVSVDLQTIRLTNRAKALRYVYLTPRLCQRLLVEFDQGINPDPFRFKLSGAHVCKAAVGKVRNRISSNGDATGTKQTKKETAKSKTAAAKTPSRSLKLPYRAALVKTGSASSGVVSRRVGGLEPPRIASARREFGLRALGGPQLRK